VVARPKPAVARSRKGGSVVVLAPWLRERIARAGKGNGGNGAGRGGAVEAEVGKEAAKGSRGCDRVGLV
jgi:hypothetical protein